jgi:hypothetical protein
MGVSFLMQDEEIIYGIQAKKRFQAKYKISVVPHSSRRARSKMITTIDTNISD